MKVTDRNDNQLIINSDADLQEAIAELELKRISQKAKLEDSLNNFKEGLKPSNLAKSAFYKITEGQTPLELGLKIGGTIATGLLLKKAISKKKRSSQEQEEEQYEKKDGTSFLTKIALTAAGNYIVGKIPTATAYAAATVNQLFKKKEKV